MSVLTLLVVLIVVGAALYVVNSALPIDPKIRVIINAVVVVLVLVWVLDAFFGLGSLRTPTIRSH